MALDFGELFPLFDRLLWLGAFGRRNLRLSDLLLLLRRCLNRRHLLLVHILVSILLLIHLLSLIRLFLSFLFRLLLLALILIGVLLLEHLLRLISLIYSRLVVGVLVLVIRLGPWLHLNHVAVFASLEPRIGLVLIQLMLRFIRLPLSIIVFILLQLFDELVHGLLVVHVCFAFVPLALARAAARRQQQRHGELTT